VEILVEDAIQIHATVNQTASQIVDQNQSHATFVDLKAPKDHRVLADHRDVKELKVDVAHKENQDVEDKRVHVASKENQD